MAATTAATTAAATWAAATRAAATTCGPRNALEAGEGGAGARVAESESRLGCQRSAWGWSRRQPASVGASRRLPIAPRAAERGGARLGSYSFKLRAV